MISYKDNWEIIKKRMTLVWNNEIYDRPCISVRCLKDKSRPYTDTFPKDPSKIKDYYFNPELMLERGIDYFEKTYFGGDSFPVILPGWGCNGHAKYLESQEMYEANSHVEKGTVWLDPVFDDYNKFNFNFDRNNPLYQAELQALKYLAEEGKGKFFVAMPDNCGTYDALAALRGNSDFITDFIDEPAAVKMAANKMVDMLIESGDEMLEALRENCDGGSINGWYHTWSPGKHMQIQCDLSAMISPAMYEEFIMEELERTTNWLDNSIYHMDGVEQTRFLDMLLSLKKLNMIQWSQVIKQPDITHNFHYVQKIQDAGKGIVLLITKNQLDKVLDNVAPEGRFLIVEDAENPEEADNIVDHVAKHSFKRKIYAVE